MGRKKVIEIVLDTETTGLDYTREKMVEFAAVRLENGKIKDEFQTLINPHQHIRKSSIAIHGITPEMVEDAPTEEEILPRILEFIGDYPIVAHNAIFDYSFLNEASLRVLGKELTNPRIDTQQMFKEIYPDVPLINYCEWYYNWKNSDADFEGVQLNDNQRAFIKSKNAGMLLDVFPKERDVGEIQFVGDFLNRLVAPLQHIADILEDRLVYQVGSRFPAKFLADRRKVFGCDMEPVGV